MASTPQNPAQAEGDPARATDPFGRYGSVVSQSFSARPRRIRLVAGRTMTEGDTVGRGAIEVVAAGGVADDAVIADGGSAIVGIGGVMSGASVLSGGSQTVRSGGVAMGTTVAAGGFAYAAAGADFRGATIAGGTVEIAAGAFTSGVIAFSGTGGTLQIDGTSLRGTTISGFAAGDAIDLAGISFHRNGRVSLGPGNVLRVVEGRQSYAFRLDPRQDFAGQTFQLSAAGDGSVVLTVGRDAPCFASGTLIRTSRGEVAVEDLRVGDLAVTADGDERPVRWLGHRTLDFRGGRDPASAWPVRIRAGALGPGRPCRDLWVSPGHSVCVDLLGEVLVTAGEIVNGATVEQVPVDGVTYWHVELDSHDILLAEGLPAESYLDMGNRRFFAGADDLGPDPAAAARTKADFCRPAVLDRVLLDAIRSRLRTRALALGWRLDAPDDDAHLLVDGRVVRPDRAAGTARFVVPADAAEVWLASRTFVPRHVCDGGDPRRLGVMVHALSVDDGLGTAFPVPLDDPRLGDGFYGLESQDGAAMRWTDGRARLPAALWEGCRGTFFLKVALSSDGLLCWSPPPAPAAERPSAPLQAGTLRLVAA